MTRLYVADFGSLFAWKFFAHENEVDGGLLGFQRWYEAFCKEMQPTHFVVCFDAGHDRRAAIDPEYKIARKAKPKTPDYVEQLRRAPAFVMGELGIPALRCVGEEADDCIASIVTQHTAPGREIIMVSTDKDLSALVSETTQLYDPKPHGKGGECRFWDIAGVTERMGVPPWRVVDLLSMAGDAADGIKGIRGIGNDRALIALRQTKSMAELFRKAAKGELTGLGKKTMSTIANGRAEYEHAKKLVEMRLDIPTPKDFEAFALRKVAAA